VKLQPEHPSDVVKARTLDVLAKMVGQFPTDSPSFEALRAVASGDEPLWLMVNLPGLTKVVKDVSDDVAKREARQKEKIDSIKREMKGNYRKLWKRWERVAGPAGNDTPANFLAWLEGVTEATRYAQPRLEVLWSVVCSPVRRRFGRLGAAPIESMTGGDLKARVEEAFGQVTMIEEGANNDFEGQGRRSAQYAMGDVAWHTGISRHADVLALARELANSVEKWSRVAQDMGNPEAIATMRSQVDLAAGVVGACRSAWNEVVPGVTLQQLALAGPSAGPVSISDASSPPLP
jgi:hypothetical protein